MASGNPLKQCQIHILILFFRLLRNLPAGPFWSAIPSTASLFRPKSLYRTVPKIVEVWRTHFDHRGAAEVQIILGPSIFHQKLRDDGVQHRGLPGRPRLSLHGSKVLQEVWRFRGSRQSLETQGWFILQSHPVLLPHVRHLRQDWPPTADFKEAFPELFEDFNRAVPVPDYTRRDGVLNIASHFPTNHIAPDIGE